MVTGLRTAALLLGLVAPLSQGERAHGTASSGSVFSIDDFGAVDAENSVEAATANAAALTAALEAAHSAGRGTVVVPSDGVYYTLPFSGKNHVGVTLVVDGTIKVMQIAEAPDDPAGDARPEVSCVENMLKLIEAL